MARTLGVVILAAGQGTRMKSALPKVLHPVCGVPMVAHILAAARELAPASLAVVIGHGGKQVRDTLAAADVTFVQQTELLGTADAVRRCRDAMAGCEDVMVLNGDSPLIGAELLRALRDARSPADPFAFVTCQVSDPGRLGRVVRDGDGLVERIVEAADYEGPGGPAEVNAGQYVFDAARLWAGIIQVPKSAKGEYYLTDMVHIAVSTWTPPVTIDADPSEALGVDDRVKLAEAEQIMRAHILEQHMLEGVTIADPATTYIDANVRIESDVTILPGCALRGETRIATGCIVGPATSLTNARVGRDSTIRNSVVEDSQIGERVRIGPFAHLRSNAVIGDDCEIGNYAEIKNSIIGNRVKMHHFSYIGDADVGDETNIAAGVITCNYDGVNKYRTTIGRKVFIGCDTMLVAPVSLGDGALTGAGSVVTKDVRAGGRVAGVPARALPHVKRPGH